MDIRTLALINARLTCARLVSWAITDEANKSANSEIFMVRSPQERLCWLKYFGEVVREVRGSFYDMPAIYLAQSGGNCSARRDGTTYEPTRTT